MNQQFADTDQDATVLTDVRSEQIRILYSAIPTSLATILVNSIILSVVHWEVVDQASIAAWFISTNLLSVIRLYMYRQFNQLDKNEKVGDLWYQRAMMTSIVSGMTWAAAGFILFAEQSLVHQTFLAFVIAGMSAGAITTLAAILNAARAFLVIALIPIVIQFNLADNAFSLPMTGMTILFMVMLLVSAKRINQTILESLVGRYERELVEQKIRYQALYDELTDLPNRRLLLKILHQEIAKAERHKRFGAVLFIDLDRFKAVNDSLGHSIGDALLVNVARIIKKRLRKEDIAARIGGDEFVLLLPEVGDDLDNAGSNASNIANEIRQCFESPFVIDGHSIHLTISIGIGLFPGNAEPEDFIKYADIAMYEAKAEGRNKVRLFSTEMQATVDQYRIVEEGLHHALGNGELELYFQTQQDGGHRVIGAEALLRWNHPGGKILAPGAFIDIAEQSGLIVPIGEWVLYSACEHLNRIGLKKNFTLSVNVSPRQFTNPSFVDHLKQTLLETGANPRMLRLEITEGLAIEDIEHTIETMNQLKLLGITFSLDDFGTGYSSLSYLNRLPVDELKIDRSFVQNISSSPENAIIVDTIIFMAKSLNLEIVAEGVETKSELDYLMRRECNIFQGYYFAKPRPFGELQT